MTAVESADVGAFLVAQTVKDTLRFITCGSVDDGKSTLIGRLLYESKSIFDDQLKALEVESRQFGTQGGNLDFALLLDGLLAEREQGITIDVDIASLPPGCVDLSWPTRPDTSNSPAIWQPAHRRRAWR